MGVSATTATLFLLGRRTRQHPATSNWLVGFDRRILALELLVLGIFLASLGTVARSWIGWNGVVLLGGVGGAGILLPLWLHRLEPVTSTARSPDRLTAPAAAGLVLLGSFLLRLVVLLSSAQIQAVGSGVSR